MVPPTLRHHGTVTLLELLAGTARTRVVPLHVGPVCTGGRAAGDTWHTSGRLRRERLLPPQPDDRGIGTRCRDFLRRRFRGTDVHVLVGARRRPRNVFDVFQNSERVVMPCRARRRWRRRGLATVAALLALEHDLRAREAL